MKYIPKTEKVRMCPIEYGLDQFGGKWKSRILCVLSSKPNVRYSEIKKTMNNITDTVLAAMLKALVADKLVTRYQSKEMPPKVEYSLTEKGKSVLPILKTICRWSREHSTDDLATLLPQCLACNQMR